MKRYLAAVTVVIGLAMPAVAFAGPKEDALATITKFLDTFNAGKLDEIVALFTPDAVMWGTTMTEVGTGSTAVRGYFTPAFAGRAPGLVTKAKALTTEVLQVSDTAVLVAGQWYIERSGPAGLTIPAPSDLRYTFLVVKRGDQWQIAHLHSSTRPVPAAPAPAAAATPPPAAPR